MDLAAAQIIIENRLYTEWVNTYSTLYGNAYSIPIFYGNVESNKPSSGKWAEITVLNGEQSQISFGRANPGYRQVGIIQVDIRDDLGSADKESLRLAEVASSVFRGKSVSGLQFKGRTIVGPRREDQWNRTIVSIPFYWDENYTI